MRPSLLRSLFQALACASFLASALPAQSAVPNLVQNGDFASGLSGWQSTGSSVYSGVVSLDCNGDSATSACFAVTPDSSSNPFLLTRSLPLQQSSRYWLRLDLRATGELRGNESRLEVYLGDKAFDRQSLIAQTKAHAGVNPMMVELAAPFSVSCSCTWLTLAFSTAKPGGTNSFRLHVDDIEVFAESGIPWATCYTDRFNQPQMLGIRAYGRRSNAYVLILSGLRLSPPLTIPGMLGQLELNPAGGWFLMDTGVFNTAGTEGTTVALPAPVYKEFLGVPLHWMPIEVDPSPLQIGLGKASTWSWL